MLEEIGHSEVFSVFVFGYNSHFDCFIRYFIKNDLDEFEKYIQGERFKKAFSLFVENFRKAENIRKSILLYKESPKDFYTYHKENNQITYKSTSEINHKFDDFVTAIYRTYQTFFEFIDIFDIDKNDLHKEYYIENSTKEEELYKYLCDQTNENKDFFHKHFKIIREIIEDTKERRNFGIDHSFSNRRLELEGRILYSLDQQGEVTSLQTPTTQFNKKTTNVFDYVDIVFLNFLVHFQHIIAMYSNNILDRKYKEEGTTNPDIKSFFLDVNHLKSIYKDKYELALGHLQVMSEYQRYHFGSFMEGQFVPMSCSGLINPAIRYQDHIEININEPNLSLIKSKAQTIIGRMSSKKLRNLKAGDRVLVSRKFPAVIEEVKNFKLFKEMFEHYGLKNCLPNVVSIEEGLKIYDNFYSEADVAKYGVTALKIAVQNY